MSTLTRSTALKIAAVLSVIVAVIGIVFYDLPTLAAGAAAAEGEFPLVLGSFATDVLAFVAAYGAWRSQKWGAVLLIVINAFWLVQAVSSLFVDTGTFAVAFAAVMFTHHVVVIALCLWRERVVATV